MDDEIKVGEYIRCGSIGIRKVVQVLKSPITLKVNKVVDENGLLIAKHYIKKHSKNILKLIEKGDLVNGYIITSEYMMSDGTIYQEGARFNRLVLLKAKDVKTIMTHEQIEAKQYVVGGKKCEK